MKNYYLLLFLFIGLFGKAQIISIPDANFKAKLLAASPSIGIAKDINGNNIKIDLNNNTEIEVSEVLIVRQLLVSSSYIQSLEGISNFTNLTHLDCSQNQLSNLNVNELVNLQNLNCSQNHFSNLNVNGLVNLQNLNCSHNQLSNLNVNGLINLTILYCHNNQLSSLNVDGLQNLNSLLCANNQLTNLNFTGVINLIDLYCTNNQLVSLNVDGLLNLHNLSCSANQLTNLNVNGLVNLTNLSCSDNQLSNLNVTDLINLTHLNCNTNLLTNLNVSGLVNLNNLNCQYNDLTSLNVNGLINLTHLFCHNNQLSSLNLNELVNLSALYCSNNQLLTLNLSNLFNLNSLNCSNNLLTSLFVKNGINSNNYFGGNLDLVYICADEGEIASINQSIASTIPIINCVVNSYCSFKPGGQFYTIQGQNKYDNENDNCDIGDDFIPNIKYSISNGGESGSIVSDNAGNYSIPVQSGTHTITPILENPSYFNVSPPNLVVNFPTQSSPFTQNFCITPNGEIHDVEITIMPLNQARPGFDCNYKIVYKNKGNQTENGTINLAFDDTIFDFVSSSFAISSQTLGNLYWNYSNLQPFETRSIDVVLNLNSPMETPAVNGGDILNLITTITSPDEIPCNNWLQSQCDNIFTLNQTVVNSFDPNDKTCLEGNTISPVRVGGFVHYMIRFENTGTFPAENIVVKDTIDITKFDVSSLVPLDASHNYVTKITDNKVEFIFENINLQFDDANNDGYIAFKIKTVPTLVLGNTFSNSANIYFDYNFPIITNTATTTIAALSNPSFEFSNYFSLYPNPTTNELNINLKSAVEINSIQIYNTIGQLVTVQTGNALIVDVSNLKTGNYFIKIYTNEGFSTSQFIKE